ncbi:helix-turn-helix domain-containing protein [Aurantiacibacter sediminis]|uniref:DUF4019 domain-containing protein n=1 Tax=Aurantiacibacter sediminis TaxID=2793064 RepID=A0ABS0N486_9SPHN|nr:DUF4019 domain-containing protein [Aurantiacibacter sediminis]MBH5322789.1 DUF4019 domain-containing protein [Aurantiacibacter sediminis]
MADALGDLTEKEKEALRLLLAGHDAKSSARELDISVHTVNDRLRNARRKLDVSSSREAARILGDAEGAIPQNPARNDLGMGDENGVEDTADLNETGGPSRIVWLAGGMLTMSLIIAIAAVALIAEDTPPTDTVAGDDFTSEADIAATQTDGESREAAETFIALVDAGDYQGSWEAAGSFFQSKTTAEQWASLVEPVREPLGAVTSREIASVQRADSLPGAPDGEYEVLQFATVFEGRPQAVVETVIMLDSDEGWQVTGYFVR